MILCDTNIFIHIFNGDEKTINAFYQIGRGNIILSSITLMELYQGMRNRNELDAMRKKIKYFDVVEIDPAISRMARRYIEKYKLSHNLGIPDAIIAASAVANRLELFTYNLKDFSFIPGIKIYSPAE